MASGAPVVASAHESMDEASGAAAIRADPESPQSIASGILQAITRRDELRAKGIEHVRNFTWRRTGEVFLEGYERFA
jgi:glycosyltransferase involved in cell wall biosynthesis